METPWWGQRENNLNSKGVSARSLPLKVSRVDEATELYRP